MTEKLTQGGSTTIKDNPDLDGIILDPTKEIKTISSYDVFEKCVIRAENLITVRESTESIEGISDEHYCDCYRAAVVLTISALDAFVRKIVISEISKVVSNSKLNSSHKCNIIVK